MELWFRKCRGFWWLSLLLVGCWPSFRGVKAEDWAAGAGLAFPAKPSFEGYQLVSAVGDLRFEWPVAVASPPGETNRLFVVEKLGRIVVVTNLANPTRSIFLDLTESVDTSDMETGLLGLAFHPGFATNGSFFVYRTLLTTTLGRTNFLHDQLSRFQVSETDSNAADPNSEVVLFSLPDSAVFHNGGDLHFGPDGYLYVSVGEDYDLWVAPPINRQPIDGNLQGGLLRIDVDLRPDSLPPNPHPGVTQNYAVPPDNPFVGATHHNGFPVDPAKLRTEFWAIGFRNPWRFSIDSVSGTLYCADVGDFRMEEVNRIRPGGNYGWPFYEGTLASPYIPEGAPLLFQAETPWISYFRGSGDNQGNCVVGGLVYRGRELPELQGAYIFGDYARGHIWAAFEGADGISVDVQRLTGSTSISAFGTDPRDGELLVANVREGTLSRLVRVPAEVAIKGFPQLLSETGAFVDLVSLQPSPGVNFYEINVPFWSDFAIKRRFFSLPEGAQFGFREDDPWLLPDGAVWIKHFELEMVQGDSASRRRIETRFLVQSAGEMYGVTYRWDHSQTNARLVSANGMEETFVIQDADGGFIRAQNWRYPSHNECRTCHNRSAGFALGFNTAQLNRALTQAPHGSQLQALVEAGYLSGLTNQISDLRSLKRADDVTAPLLDRARSYLAANCSACHHPGSGLVNGAFWDARFHVPLAESHIASPYYVALGASGQSLLWQRIMPSGPYQMPPIASTIHNSEGASLLQQWIDSVPPNSWTAQDLGSPAVDGSSSFRGGRYSVAGGGHWGGTNEQFHFLNQNWAGDRQVVVRLLSLTGTNSAARGGLMLRRNESPSSPFVSLMAAPDGQLRLESRDVEGAQPITAGIMGVSTPVWLRLTQQGRAISAYYSVEGTQWHSVGAVQLDLGDSPRVGLAVTSGQSKQVSLGEFEEFSIPSVSLTETQLVQNPVAPAAVLLRAQVEASTSLLNSLKVEFFAGGTKIGEALGAPFELLWRDAPAGEHLVIGRLVDEMGRALESLPITVSIGLPPTSAVFVRRDDTTAGDWRGRYGAAGYRLAGDPPPAGFKNRIDFTRGFEFVWDELPDSSNALQRASGDGRVAACWVAGDNPELTVTIPDGRPHWLTVYLLDWDTLNGRSQQVELWSEDGAQLLDSQEVRDFSGGVYLTWRVRGSVRVVPRSLTQANSTLSAIFLDETREVPPRIEWSASLSNAVEVLPFDPVLEVNVTPGSAPIHRVEYFANLKRLGVTSFPPYTFRWNSPLVGEYEVVGQVWDTAGLTSLTGPMTFRLLRPETKVNFLGSDDSLNGNWRGIYGKEGYWIPGDSTNLAVTTTLDLGGEVYVWPVESPAAPALQRSQGDGRIASALFGYGEVTVQFDILDGRPRTVGLYLLDWDQIGREIVIEVIDLKTWAMLDTQTTRRFEQGRLLRWRLEGSVRFRIGALAGNSALAALFVDSPDLILEHWRQTYFTPDQLEDSEISSPEADPEGDGLSNLLEFALGLDPWRSDAAQGLRAGWGENGWWLEYRRRTDVPGLLYTIETSADLTTWETADGIFGPETALGDSGSVWLDVRREQTTSELPDQPRFIRLRLVQESP
ncbi:MAG: PQQ-dependent sugar dehydrogenase [Verrucomicrobia bacterium]|nr:PQQ-dependent sugar dehydrogenase [Verrucomicrobiota bacterium]